LKDCTFKPKISSPPKYLGKHPLIAGKTVVQTKELVKDNTKYSEKYKDIGSRLMLTEENKKVRRVKGITLSDFNLSAKKDLLAEGVDSPSVGCKIKKSINYKDAVKDLHIRLSRINI
jgi:hypothetical protein